MKAFLARKTFACPHCQQQIQLPERAEKLVSSGLFVAVIIAPLFYYWGWNAIDPKILFALGLAITITGLILQKLQKVETTAPAQPLNDDSDDSDETSNHG